MKTLRYMNMMLTVLAVLLGLQLWTTWTAVPPVARTAWGEGIPDAGAQRQQIVDQLKLLNEKTEKINGLLTSGKVVVTVKETDSQ